MKVQGRNCEYRGRPSGANRFSRRHLGVALGLAGALSAATLIIGTPEPVQARTDASGDCVTVPLGSQGRAICTYAGFEPSVRLDSLVSSVGGHANSGIWIQAWGGAGGDGGAGDGHGGPGAPGGYAQTYYDDLSSYQATYGNEALFFSIGNAGTALNTSDVRVGGGGGASTLVASANVGFGTDGPCILRDPNAADGDGNTITVSSWSGDGDPCDQQNVVALAAGSGGGGGHAHHSPDGKAGGRGGIAVATTATVAARGTDGDSGYPNRAGIGGFNGTGGTNHKFPMGDATDGIGGLGGDSAGEDGGGYVGPSLFQGSDRNGIGGPGYQVTADTDNDPGCVGCDDPTFGGGGGGGFGGGGGGGGAPRHNGVKRAGSGGGGGGSYAFRGDFPPTNPPTTGAPAAEDGAVRVVIDNVGPSKVAPPPCIISLHGTGSPETLRGTTGGDAMYAYEGTDSIIAGPGDDCAHGGTGGDVMRGGRGNDLLFGNGGAGGAGGAGGCCAAVPSTKRGASSARHARKSADTITGGRGADRIVGQGGRDTLRGGRGADRVNARGGHHEVHGGRGADRIRARDGKRDVIKCGRGRDLVWADAIDRVARNCERVR